MAGLAGSILVGREESVDSSRIVACCPRFSVLDYTPSNRSTIVYFRSPYALFEDGCRDGGEGPSDVVPFFCSVMFIH